MMEGQYYIVSSTNSFCVVGSRANFQVISMMQSSSPCTKTREKVRLLQLWRDHFALHHRKNPCSSGPKTDWYPPLLKTIYQKLSMGSEPTDMVFVLRQLQCMSCWWTWPKHLTQWAERDCGWSWSTLAASQSSSAWLSHGTKTSMAKLGWTAKSLDPSLSSTVWKRVVFWHQFYSASCLNWRPWPGRYCMHQLPSWRQSI